MNDVIKTLGSLMRKDSSTLIGSLQLEYQKVLLSRHPLPLFLSKVDQTWMILLEPYSEYARRRTHTTITDGTYTHYGSASGADDLNVTGSPLDSDFISCDVPSPFVVSVPEKTTKTGPKTTTFRSKAFTAQEAWQIMRELSIVLPQLTDCDDTYPLYILVDGKSNKGTVLHGIDGNSCTLVYNKSVVDLPQLDNLRRVCIGPAVNSLVEMTASATYEVLTSQQSPNTDNTDEGCMVCVQCCWPNPTSVMCLPSSDASTSLVIRVPASGSRGLQSGELQLIDRMVGGYSAGKLYWTPRQDTTVDTAQRLRNLLSLYTGERVKQNTIKGSYSFDEILSGDLTANSATFLDSLWGVLCESESIEDLRSSVHYVFSAIESNHIRPQIHVRNTTKIGTAARALMRGQPSGHSMTDLEPLHMLIDLGLSKIRKDYVTILQAADLATHEQLSPFMRDTIDPSDYHNSVQQLRKLQLVLFVLRHLRLHLMLPPTLLATYCTEILQSLQKESENVFNKSYEFTFPIQTSDVKDVLERTLPCSWTVCMSHTDNRAADNTNDCKSSYHSSLAVTVTNVPIVTVCQEDDAFADLSLSDKGSPEKVRSKYYCNYVKTVTDPLFIV